MRISEVLISNTNIRIKDILDGLYNPELQDIINFCIVESKVADELYITTLYARIIECCLLELCGLTYKNIKFTEYVKTIVDEPSINKSTAKHRYEILTKPNNLLGSYLLNMIIDVKEVNFIKEDLHKFKVYDILTRCVIGYMESGDFPSNNYIKKFIRAFIEISE